MANSGVNQDPEPFTTDSEGTPYHQRRYRWVMLALVWFLYLTFGVVSFSLAPLVTPIIEDLNISYSQMGFILGAWPLTYILVAAVGGAVVDRLGIRKSIFLGVTIIGLSAVLRYLAGGFGSLFLCVALFGVGGPMMSIGAPKTISLWFRGKERGTAVGFYMTGIWIGGGVALATINSVIMPLAGYNWRIVFVGLGLLAFIVTRRTGEIGVRLALGAHPCDIAWPVIRNALWLAGFGLMIGIPLSFGCVRILRSILFGVNPYDPITIVLSILLILSVSALAAWLPARRAAKVDPMEALRYE